MNGGGSGEYIFFIVSFLYLQSLARNARIFVILDTRPDFLPFLLICTSKYDIPMFIANTQMYFAKYFEMVPLILT